MPELALPNPIRGILEQACYDCHSEKTRLSWFDQIVPLYWLVHRDVTRAREHLDFGALSAAPLARQRAILFEAVNQIQMGAMPPASYRVLHSQAEISTEKLATLRQWLGGWLTDNPPEAANLVASARQYEERMTRPPGPRRVRPAANGIEFFEEYRQWKIVSSTLRDDSKTLKLVLGNEIAMAAIQAGQINPWPKGTILAKLSWKQRNIADGQVVPGEFQQVAFMIKDKQKFEATAGWGWAEWIGTELQPYGKNADFAAECVACHKPLRENDFVFSMPIERREKSK